MFAAAVVLDQVGEGLVAFHHVEGGVHHRDGRGDIDEDLAKARLAVAQGAFGVAHPQQGAQGGQQHVRVHRVNQVGVGAVVQAGDDVAGLDRRRRHMNHRQQRGARFGAQLANNVEAAHVRQVHVQDQRIEGVLGNQPQALGAGARFQYAVAVVFQAPAQGIACGGVVVDDQQATVSLHQECPGPSPVE